MLRLTVAVVTRSERAAREKLAASATSMNEERSAGLTVAFMQQQVT